jgi:hypothetical protein
MKATLVKILLSIAFLVSFVHSFAQCEILNRVTPDGTMQYYMEPVNFYWTSAKSLRGCIVTDKENYFLELLPVPVPEKKTGKKLKSDLTVKLANEETYQLQHYDTRYVEEDTVMEMLFLITKKEFEFFAVHEVVSVDVDMKGEEGIRTYEFKLHKTALKEQLECFLKEEENRKKK